MKKIVVFLILTIICANLFAQNRFEFGINSGITSDALLKGEGEFEFRINSFSFDTKIGADFQIGDIKVIDYPFSLGFNYHFFSIKDKWNLSLGVSARDYINRIKSINACVNLKSSYNFNSLLCLKVGLSVGYDFTNDQNFIKGLNYQATLGLGFSFLGKDENIVRKRANDDVYFINEESKVKQNADEKAEKNIESDENIIVMNIEEYQNLLLGLEDEKRAKELKEKINKEIDDDKKSAEEIIFDNNKRAKITVEGNENYFGAICRYIYKREKIYDIFCTPRTNTDIRLKEGERIVDIKLGDSNNWLWETIENTEGGKLYQHILFRPLNVKIKTEGAIYTNQRTYFINLISYEREYQVRLEFIYPKNESASNYESINGVYNNKKSGDIGIENLIFAYKIKGDAYWKPKKVYSDGERTYIQFAPSFKNNSTAPAVYLRNQETGEEKYTNVLVNKITYILPFIISADEEIILKSGSETITIERE